MKLQKGPAIALGSFVVISLWMATGLFKDDDMAAIEAPVKSEADTLFSVQVERFHSKEITPELLIQGETAPSRHVLISSEVSGKVVSIRKREGDFVNRGEVILEIDPKGKVQQLNQAKALVKQKTLEHKANKSLLGKGLQNQTRLAASEAELAAAKAQAELIAIELGATKIKAPFAGILENRHVEIGSFLGKGDPVIQVMDFNPYIIKGFVAEKDLNQIKVGSQAFGSSIDNPEEQAQSGTIRYISSTANKSSRTFAVELEIPNPSERRADGVTANISIPLSPTQGIFISPALLSLNESGLLGTKLVNQDQHVEFAPVELVKAEAQGIWVAGLPNPVDLIVVGQSFVSSGEKVNPVYRSPIVKESVVNTDEPSQEIQANSGDSSNTASPEAMPVSESN